MLHGLFSLGLSLPSRSAASWLKPPTALRKSHAPRYLRPAYWHNNRSKLLFLGSYLCVNIILFTFAALKHVDSGPWIMLAKGCGQCLNFNCAFIVVSNAMYSLCSECVKRTEVAMVGQSRGPAKRQCKNKLILSVCILCCSSKANKNPWPPISKSGGEYQQDLSHSRATEKQERYIGHAGENLKVYKSTISL